MVCDCVVVVEGVFLEFLVEYMCCVVNSVGVVFLICGMCEGCCIFFFSIDFNEICCVFEDFVVLCFECGCIFVCMEEFGFV